MVALSQSEKEGKEMAGRRLLVASLVVNVVLSLAAIGGLVWITAAPRYWFAGAYAEQGPRGDKGPRGEQGSPGPAGPVGPDASTAIDDLSSTVDDLSSRVDTLETDLSDLQDASGGSTLETDLQDVQQKVSDICDQMALDSGALFDIYVAAC
jgi:hypothetical protein